MNGVSAEGLKPPENQETQRPLAGAKFPLYNNIYIYIYYIIKYISSTLSLPPGGTNPDFPPHAEKSTFFKDRFKSRFDTIYR